MMMALLDWTAIFYTSFASFAFNFFWYGFLFRKYRPAPPKSQNPQQTDDRKSRLFVLMMGEYMLCFIVTVFLAILLVGLTPDMFDEARKVFLMLGVLVVYSLRMWQVNAFTFVIMGYFICNVTLITYILKKWS